MLPPLAPVILTGKIVELRPLGPEHANDLGAAVGQLWELSYTNVPKPENLRAYIEVALDEQRRGLSLPFVIIERATGRILGSTRYGNISREHRRVEIGWTWITEEKQRSAVNTEMKYQLLQYAFETLGCNRVELKTDLLNERSQRAIARIGATKEGVFRRHMIMPNGRVRDTVYFSVIADEWPQVKTRLEGMMAR